MFTPIWGRFPFWLIICFRWVGSITNQKMYSQKNKLSTVHHAAGYLPEQLVSLVNFAHIFSKPWWDVFRGVLKEGYFQMSSVQNPSWLFTKGVGHIKWLRKQNLELRKDAEAKLRGVFSRKLRKPYVNECDFNNDQQENERHVFFSVLPSLKW